MNTANKLVDGDKTRRKRLKVVSACGECRRKKTKCNGEKPCAGCLKAHVECKYVFTQKPNNLTVKTIIPMGEKAPSSPSSSSSETHSSIESIEERLGAIENILRTLLGSGKNKHLLQGLQQQQQQQKHQHHHQHQQQQHSNSLCGDMYSTSSPHLVHAPQIQNRRLPREKRKRHEDDEKGVTEKRLIRDDFGHGYNKLQLAPIKIMNPGTPTIRNLLNQDDTKWFPPPQQNNNSAFFRMSSPNNTTTNSATTAAGSSS